MSNGNKNILDFITENILINILNEWLDAIDVTKLDSTFCSVAQRQRLTDILRNSKSNFRLFPTFTLEERNKKYQHLPCIEWMAARKISVKCLRIDMTDKKFGKNELEAAFNALVCLKVDEIEAYAWNDYTQTHLSALIMRCANTLKSLYIVSTTVCVTDLIERLDDCIVFSMLETLFIIDCYFKCLMLKGGCEKCEFMYNTDPNQHCGFPLNSKFTNLRVLVVMNCTHDYIAQSSFFESIVESCLQLEQLHVNACSSLNGRFLALLAQHSRHLKSVELKCTYRLQDVAKLIEACQFLSKLHLTRVNVTHYFQDSVVYYWKVFEEHKKAVKRGFNFFGSMIESDGVMFFSAIKDFSIIRCDQSIGPNSLRTIAEHSPNVKKVDFSVTDDNHTAVTELLSTCSSIVSARLGVYNNEEQAVDDSSFKILLSQLFNLTELTLDGHFLLTKQTLLDYSGKCTALRYLEITNCDLIKSYFTNDIMSIVRKDLLNNLKVRISNDSDDEEELVGDILVEDD